MNIVIRLARPDELEEILEVEHKASYRFNEFGIGPTDDEADDIENDNEDESDEFGSEHRDGIKHHRLWVALAPDNKIVGFALAQIVDQEGHLREIDVLQDFGRKGIGQALINTVIDWCHKRGYLTLTLTTFKDIPFNCPYYEKLGFYIIPDADLSGKLEEMITEERATSLLERVPMRKVLNK